MNHPTHDPETPHSGIHDFGATHTAAAPVAATIPTYRYTPQPTEQPQQLGQAVSDRARS